MSVTITCKMCKLVYPTDGFVDGSYPKCKSPETLNTIKSQTWFGCTKQFDAINKIAKSPREQMQEDLAAWIETWATAPYGVLPSLKPREDGGKGYARTITFGLARTLDATLWIWSAKHLDLQQSRDGDVHRFKSVDEFKQFCVEQYGAQL